MKKLYATFSAMNAGKSTEVLQVANNYEERDMSVILMKPSVDTKGTKYIISRIGIKREVDILISPTDNIVDLVKNYINQKQPTNLACILIDEAQFLTAVQVQQLCHIVAEMNIAIMTYFIRTDFQGNGFEGAIHLLLNANEIRERRTICACGSIATYNARKVNGAFTFEGDQVCIDNQDTVEYVSLCTRCFLKEKTKYFTKYLPKHEEHKKA